MTHENTCKSKKNLSEPNSYYAISFTNTWLCTNGGGDVNWGSRTRKESGEQAPTEVKDERTENEVVFDNHDGSFTKQIFADPINMEVDGEMKRIDATWRRSRF